MDYFLLKQDERYAYIPMLINVVKKIGPMNINRLSAHKFATEHKGLLTREYHL